MQLNDNICSFGDFIGYFVHFKGDDCVSIEDGISNVNISYVTCGPGHGISVRRFKKLLRTCLADNTDSSISLAYGCAYHSQNNNFKILRLWSHQGGLRLTPRFTGWSL
uniref:Uncharacterized protein n=1 Tax=Quercus lobata TaxID=97700 RepID=A0A7N2L633_QUELO